VSVIKCIATVYGVAKWRLQLIGFVKLSGFLLMLQAAVLDGILFDPFSFQQDGLSAPEVDVYR
jgi:hypothetical protein